MSCVEELIVRNPVNLRSLLASLDDSQCLLVSIILINLNHDILHGFSALEGLIDQIMLKCWESVDRGLAFGFFCDRFCVKNGL